MDSNRYIVHLISFFIAISLMSTGKLVHSAPKDTSKIILVEVNGTKITRATYDAYVKRRGLPKDLDENTQASMVIEELINRELIFQDGMKKKAHNSAAVKKELENMRKNIVAGEMLKRASEGHKVSEKDMKKEYQAILKRLNTNEFKARHILLETKKDAELVIASLNKGSSFEKLAKEKSTGPSAPQGGDLGWFRAEQMVKPFSDAVSLLKNGEYSNTPVKTDFGWHVILRENSRATDKPEYADVKEQIKMRLQNQGVEFYIKGLREKAKIIRK